MKKYNNDISMPEIQKLFGIDTNSKPKEKLSEYLRRKGYPSLAKLMKENGR